MSLGDIAAAFLSRPAGRVLDGPMRAAIAEVLQDQGYASPAEVRALRDAFAALQASAEATEAQARRTEQTVVALQAALDALQASLRQEVERRLAAEARLAARRCAVQPCDRDAAIGAFCAGHDADWVAGRLPDFVGPEGLVEVDGRVHELGRAAAGLPVLRDEAGRPWVGGRRLPAPPAAG